MFSFLILKSLRKRIFISALCVLSIALSLSLYFSIDKIRKGIEEGFTNSISGADLVVGARSGSLQLLLYSLFHMGSPTNNIHYSTYKEIKEDPMVAWTIPLSLGDSFHGHRVVGTDENFFKHYQFFGDHHLQFEKGSWTGKTFHVVLGAQVASKFNLKIKDKIILGHGLSEKSLVEHDQNPFEVSGILSSTGTPVDKSVYISLKGISAIHKGWQNGFPSEEGQEIEEDTDLTPDQITAFILKTKNRMALLQLRHRLNHYPTESLSAIIPAMALADLWKLLDQLEKAFQAISFFVIIIGFLTILISLYMSLNMRTDEIKILRMLGLDPLRVTTLLLGEAFLISTLGTIVGFGLHYLFLIISKPILESYYSIYLKLSSPTPEDLVILIAMIFLGGLFGFIPAIKAYRYSQHLRV